MSTVQPMVQQHPFRERMWAQLALGLYRAGRQAAALETFTRARRVLDEVASKGGERVGAVVPQLDVIDV